MRLAHRDQPLPQAIPAEVREACQRQARKAKDRGLLPIRREVPLVNVLIGIVDKKQPPASRQELAAAIFVHARTRRVGRGQQLAHPARFRPAHDRCTAPFRRPAFAPINGIPQRLHAPEAQRSLRHGCG